MARVPLDELLAGGHHGGKAALHVRRTAAVEHPVAYRGLERIALPLLERARRHHVGVSGETEYGALGAAPRPEVIDDPEA